ncbi:MAG: YceD family protein [Armatimonadota bacterium]
MKLDITELLRVPLSNVEYLVDQPCPADLGVESRSPVTGHLVFSSTSNLLMIRGEFKADLVLECVRCLEHMVVSVCAQIEEDFRLRGHQIVSGADQSEGEELDENLLAVFRNGELDLDEYIRQHLLLAMPLFPLCKEDCLGLCPHCGKNLNTGKCDCPDEDYLFSPFSDLARRLRDMDSQ